jgi:methylated-DNA-[protein]-cysteine S-methyltransferase
MSTVMAQTAVWQTLPTPFGPLTVVAEGDTVLASGFGDDTALIRRLREAGAEGGPLAPSITAAVAAYLAGDAAALDALPVRQDGGPFAQASWLAMRAIPPGQTCSYAELAAAAGRPAAIRAAGSACARNRVAPFVPCHRVVRTDGSLGGYAYGLDVKRALLAHESGLPWQEMELQPVPPQTG